MIPGTAALSSSPELWLCMQTAPNGTYRWLAHQFAHSSLWPLFCFTHAQEILTERGLSTTDCFEKGDLAKKVHAQCSSVTYYK